MKMISKYLLIGAGAIGITYYASKFVRNIYIPIVRHEIRNPLILPMNEMIKIATLSKLAYEKIECDNFKPLESLACLENLIPKYFDGSPVEDAQAYVWTGQNSVYVSFRGTEASSDIIADLDVRMIPLPSIGTNVRVHLGFYRQFTSIKDQIWEYLSKYECESVVFCGHSLGAAVATIAAVAYAKEFPDKHVKCFTVGSPRVGNKHFCKEFNTSVAQNYRIFNENDPVSMIPMSMRFQHVDNAVCIYDNGKKYMQKHDYHWLLRPFLSSQELDYTNLICDHNCKLYIDRLNIG